MQKKVVKQFHQSHQTITGTILVADDQAANRELLEELLAAQGCKVITVPDGTAAVEELARTQVDLVLLDVMMPRLNGFEACEKIKTSPDTYLIPVIMITALSDHACKDLCLQCSGPTRTGLTLPARVHPFAA